jgi:hypothetical protein
MYRSLFVLSSVILATAQGATAATLSIVLRDDPQTVVLTLDDFVTYDCTSHEFKLTDAGEKKLDDDIGAGDVSVHEGLPFRVLVDGKKAYDGVFWSMLSSFFPPKGVLITVPIGRSFEFVKGAGVKDPRRNREVFEAFRSVGKLAGQCRR